MGQGGYAFQQGLGAEEIRGIVSDTMMAMLPGVQQALPQQASSNDEVINQILKTQEELAHNQEMFMQQLNHQPTERVVEREVAGTIVGVNVNDATIKQILENQEILMDKIAELSAKQNAEPQIVEKIIEKEVPIEKVVEKIVEVPVEVEKVVEKEVVKEVKVAATAKPKKEVAARLTLDEAYALLTKEQKKFFDGLKAHAMAKDKCKEKKSTYFTVFGATTANPLLKLTIKKDTVVALLKMEDEFMKDLRRDASGDGTKVKVKETEIIVSDAQAFDTAKKMIDLREDQIDRYADLLKEQRAASKRK